MGVGYIAFPCEDKDEKPQFNLRYGLGNKTKLTKEDYEDGNYPELGKHVRLVPVTPEIYQKRQKSALRFKSILDDVSTTNEMIIAMRQHSGNFPVYAVRNGNKLVCFKINDKGEKQENTNGQDWIFNSDVYQKKHPPKK